MALKGAALVDVGEGDDPVFNVIRNDEVLFDPSPASCCVAISNGRYVVTALIPEGPRAFDLRSSDTMILDPGCEVSETNIFGYFMICQSGRASTILQRRLGGETISLIGIDLGLKWNRMSSSPRGRAFFGGFRREGRI